MERGRGMKPRPWEDSKIGGPTGQGIKANLFSHPRLDRVWDLRWCLQRLGSRLTKEDVDEIRLPGRDEVDVEEVEEKSSQH